MAWHGPKHAAALRVLINVVFDGYLKTRALKSRTNQHHSLRHHPLLLPTAPHPNGDVYATTFPLQLKMLWRIAVLCVVVCVTTCLRSGSSISNRQRKTNGGYAARTDSGLVTGNSQQPYLSYIKLHPGQVKLYFIYTEVASITNRVKVNNK